jgi:urease accessory protein
VRQAVVRTAQDVERYVTSVLTQTIATLEARAAYIACNVARAGDLPAVLACDRSLHTMKPALELRQASLMTGRRFLEEVAVHAEPAFLASYRREVGGDESLGNYAVAFGVVAASQGIKSRYVPAAVMLSGVTAIVQAAMRLMRVSHRDVQAVLHRLRPLIARLAADVRKETETGEAALLFAGFHPLQDIASMRHARAEARLFAS